MWYEVTATSIHEAMNYLYEASVCTSQCISRLVWMARLNLVLKCGNVSKM